MAQTPRCEDLDISEKFKRLTVKEIKPLNQQLGIGAYGRVYKVTYLGIITFAAKEIHPILAQTRTWQLEKFKQECVCYSELIHPNILGFVGLYYPTSESLPAIVTELMDESLIDYVKKPHISLKRKISILHDVAEGLHYLHTYNPPVIHRDLSPGNVLLKHSGVDQVPPVAKVGDLSVAKGVDISNISTVQQLTTAPGILDFMPPEALIPSPKYDISLDVFSYGGIILHTVNQEWPTPKAQAEFDPVSCQCRGLCEIERRKEHLDKMTGEAEVLKPLAESCLDNDPALRPPISHLSKMMYPMKVCAHLCW